MTEAGYARILLDKKDTQIMGLESEITKLRIEYERQIKKLQKENADLKKACDETQELLDKQIEATYKLDKENAELKTKVTALENANRAMVKELDDTTSGGLNILQNVVKNKEELTKAKEYIKLLLMNCVGVYESTGKTIAEIQAEAEQFISELEK